jgi:uncharacterized protein (TIGR02391 family)
VDDLLSIFEKIARKAFQFTDTEPERIEARHPFEERNIHQDFPDTVRKLFDDGHYSQAAFEAFKFLDKEIQRISGCCETGYKLIMQVLSDSSPIIALTPNSNTSEKDEQKGYQFLFAGSMLAIRNPRGHEYSFKDPPDLCLDHLSLASMLIRRLEQAGFTIKKT